MEGERIVTVVRQVNLDGVTRTRGDLVFTTGRVLFLKTAGKLDVIESVFGIAGSLVAGGSSRRASEELGKLPVEQLLASPAKVAEYSFVDLEEIRVKERRLRRSLVILRPRSGKRRKYWGKRRALAGLVAAAEELTALGGPVRLGRR